MIHRYILGQSLIELVSLTIWQQCRIWLSRAAEDREENRVLRLGCGGDRFFLGTWKMRGVLAEDRPIRTLREVLDRLQDAYCGTTGYEVGPAGGAHLFVSPAPPALYNQPFFYFTLID